MVTTPLDAKAKLEAEGLQVSCNNSHSLWIAATLRDTEAGIKLSQDACCLIWNAGRWVAVFPAEGLLTYEVPGSLSELVSLITAVYANYRQVGGPWNNILKRIVPDADQFLVRPSPAHV